MQISDRAQNCVALTLVMLLASACVGVGGTTAPPGQTAGQSVTPGTTASTDPTTDPGRPTEGPQGNLEKFIAWIVGLGPGSPTGPPEIDVYQDIRQGAEETCRRALKTPLEEHETEILYHGAAAACLAALHGKEDRWAEAEQAIATLRRPDGCLDQNIYDLLKSVLDAHHANPNVAFTLQGKPDKGKPDKISLPCPRMRDVTVTRSSGTLEIEARGARLEKVVQLMYAPVDTCQLPDDMTSQTGVEPVGDGSIIRGQITGDSEATATSLMWIGAMVSQGDWIADSDCVRVLDTQPPDPSPGPSD